jgi:DNA-binding MarR family transcriptional regulator
LARRDGEFVIEENTAHLVALANRLFTQALQVRFSTHGVAVGQWPILLHLWDEDGLNQKELSRRVQIEEPTAARTLERMERDGLVRRARNTRDRRQVNVFLTERGAALKDELVPYALEVSRVATAGLSDQDKAKINSLLGYLIARLQ